MTLRVRILQFGGSNNFSQKSSKKNSKPFLWSVEFSFSLKSFYQIPLTWSKYYHQCWLLLVGILQIRASHKSSQSWKYFWLQKNVEFIDRIWGDVQWFILFIWILDNHGNITTMRRMFVIRFQVRVHSILSVLNHAFSY